MTLLFSFSPSLEVITPSAFTIAPAMALTADMHKVVPHMNSTMILILNPANCVSIHSSLSLYVIPHLMRNPFFLSPGFPPSRE